jgi:hypothetical protein
MHMKYYKNDGKECIDGRKPKEITLEVALQEIENLPFTVRDNFIGFINEKGETIQFPRYEKDNWLIDVPVIEKGRFACSLNDSDLTTEKVKEIVKKFFLGENWQSLCNLKRS